MRSDEEQPTVIDIIANHRAGTIRKKMNKKINIDLFSFISFL
jgi:hypothetical protein